MHSFNIEYSEEKNELLRKTRGVCFEDVRDALEEDGFISILDNKKKSYEHQHILVVKINSYVHAVPFVWKGKKKEVAFLKTVYPDRLLQKLHIRS